MIPETERYKTPEQRGLLYRRFLDSIRALPGVESAGTVDALPFSGENHGALTSNSEAGVMEVHGQVPAEINVVSTEYRQSMGVRLNEAMISFCPKEEIRGIHPALALKCHR